MLAAFAVRADPVPLDGGQGRSWRAGDLVLAPDDDACVTACLAPVLAGVAERGFRVARPVRTVEGRWAAHGWTASRVVVGREGAGGRWGELLAAARAFHLAVRDVPRPPCLARRTHRWARADRAAWGEERWDPHPAVAGTAARLAAASAGTRERPQLVHGDLSGNVLFADGLAPAIIDVSPYWRPPSYAEGVVVADALLAHPDGPDLLADPGTGVPVAAVARGLLFRLFDLDQRLADGGLDVERAVAPYVRATGLLDGQT